MQSATSIGTVSLVQPELQPRTRITPPHASFEASTQKLTPPGPQQHPLG